MPRADHDQPPEELVRLGKAVRSLRKKAGAKQIEVATAAGISESQVSDVERGANNPGWLLLVRIVEVGVGSTMAALAAEYDGAK